jgi:nitrite reductase (NADH) large subunit
MSSNARTMLIIGDGMAGITAAQEMRRRDASARIMVVSEEREPYYYRASLSEWIAGRITRDMLGGRSPAFYDDMRLQRIVGRVTRVEADDHVVILADGRRIAYDRLLIATGASPNKLSVPGLVATQTLTFRSMADAERIRALVTMDARILVIGGGVLGLELLGALAHAGLRRLGLVHLHATVGAPILDGPAAEILQARMRHHGVDLLLEDALQAVDGQVAILQSGETWPFDRVVQAIGITPVFPAVDGLDVGRGIRIDATCRTNLPDIYAAGDCAELLDSSGAWRPTRIWRDCGRQGRVVGANMVGGSLRLGSEPLFNASWIYDLAYSLIGDAHGPEGEDLVWQDGNAYRKVKRVDGRLAGALLLGQRQSSQSMYAALGCDISHYGAEVASPEFDWNDLSGQNWDYAFF